MNFFDWICWSDRKIRLVDGVAQYILGLNILVIDSVLKFSIAVFLLWTSTRIIIQEQGEYQGLRKMYVLLSNLEYIGKQSLTTIHIQLKISKNRQFHVRVCSCSISFRYQVRQGQISVLWYFLECRNLCDITFSKLKWTYEKSWVRNWKHGLQGKNVAI